MAGEINKQEANRRYMDLAAQIGQAITSFSMIESNLNSLFAHCIGVPQDVAARMLMVVRNFSQALDITDVAVRHRLQGTEALTHWQSLLDYIRELSGDRNYLAHTPIVDHVYGDNPRPKVGPHINSYLTGEPPRLHPMTFEDVTELGLDFDEAAEFISTLNMALAHSSLDRFARPVVRRRPPRGKRQAAALQAQPNPPASSRQ
jgi:hypothetical protein